MGSAETSEDVSTDFGMNGGTSLHTRKGQASRSAKHNVFLTLPAKLLVMVADPQSSLSGRIPLDDDRNRLLAVRLYHLKSKGFPPPSCPWSLARAIPCNSTQSLS